MKPLNRTTRWSGNNFKPYLTYTDILHLTQMHRTTLTRHLKKLVKVRVVKRLGPGESKSKLKLSRKNQTFYRVNVEPNGELMPDWIWYLEDEYIYPFLSFHRHLGIVIMRDHHAVIGGCMVNELKLDHLTNRHSDSFPLSLVPSSSISNR
jgi:DNA-binding Lrp family transcriptional regulator